MVVISRLGNTAMVRLPRLSEGEAEGASMINVGRREFITLLGGAAAWPVVARAQKPARLPTIGFLGTATSSAWSEWVAAFVRRLSEHGWIEGSTIAIEYR